VAVLSRETYELFVFLTPLSLSLSPARACSASPGLLHCPFVVRSAAFVSPFIFSVFSPPLSQRFFEIPLKLLLFSRLGVFLLQSSNIRIVKVFCISDFSVLVFLLSCMFAGYLLVCKYPVFFFFGLFV
jgi:hypothetical protein